MISVPSGCQGTGRLKTNNGLGLALIIVASGVSSAFWFTYTVFRQEIKTSLEYFKNITAELFVIV